MSLMRSIRDYPVPGGSVAAWWLGQNGYIFKTHEGTLVSVDLYLTDSVPELVPDCPVDLHRMQPVFLAPEELETDVYACTHSHIDHADPWTIRGLRNRDTMQFMGPPQTCSLFRNLGVEDGRITPLWAGGETVFRDVRIKGTFALPTDDTDLDHLGFLLTFSDRLKIYITGDTDMSDLLASTARDAPHAMIACINGNYNNLSHWEAAEVARWIGPKTAIPCHYDMFPDNSADPRQFRASLKIRAPRVAYLELPHAEPFLFEP